MNREDLELELIKLQIEQHKVDLERSKKYADQPVIDTEACKQEMLRRNIECLVNVKKNALDVNALILKAVNSLVVE